MNRVMALIALSCALALSACASHVAPPIASRDRPAAPAQDATVSAIGAAIGPSLYKSHW